MELDKETKKTIYEGQLVYDFVQSDNWKFVKGKLDDLVKDVGSIFTLEEKDPIELKTQIAARQIAVATIKAWVEDMEGSAEQFNSYSELLKKQQTENYMRVVE